MGSAVSPRAEDQPLFTADLNDPITSIYWAECGMGHLIPRYHTHGVVVCERCEVFLTPSWYFQASIWV